MSQQLIASYDATEFAFVLQSISHAARPMNAVPGLVDKAADSPEPPTITAPDGGQVTDIVLTILSVSVGAT